MPEKYVLQHTGAVSFETQRLICRRFIPTDAEDMFRYWASDPLVQSEYGEPVYDTPEKAVKLLKKYISDNYRWAIIEGSSGRNIGQIAFCRVYPDCRTAEIEYCIGRSFWGNGYAGEALNGLIAHTFAHTEILKLEAYHRNENTRFGRVLEKSPMHVAANVERFSRENKLPHGETCYCITVVEYQKQIQLLQERICQT